MIDKQILNENKCFKCSIKWTKFSPLVYITNRMFCGNCAPVVMKAMNNIWLEEAMRRVDGSNNP